MGSGQYHCSSKPRFGVRFPRSSAMATRVETSRSSQTPSLPISRLRPPPAETCSGHAYNIAGGAAHTLLNLLAILERICEVEIKPLHAEARPGDVRHSQADIRASRDELGYEAEVAIEEGVRHTVEWLPAHAGERAKNQGG